ncbi:MAG: RNA polymerase sigma factor [Myxococcota bacterium]|nr:RNA polymerase sigma factor [Myxococcota bacterium]
MMMFRLSHCPCVAYNPTDTMWYFLFLLAVGSVRKAVDWTSQKQHALIAAILEGDRSAAAWLFRKHYGGMMRVARGLLGNESVAAEVVQETWESVFKGLKSFRGEASLTTWIFRILVNKAHRVGKREARTIPFSGLHRDAGDRVQDQIADEFSAKGHWRSEVHSWRTYDPQEEAINREGLKLLADGLEQLPESQRVVVTLRDVEGLDAAEVCSMLGLSGGNQRQLLHRGRTRLRQILEAAEWQMDAAPGKVE